MSEKWAILDLDGTMYRGSERIPGAAAAVASMRQAGMPFLFVTNNSSRSPEKVADHLHRVGIPCHADEILTSAQAALQYIVEQQVGQRLFVIGEEGLQQAVAKAGLKVVNDEPDLVVQGLDRSFNYDKLARAVQFIRSGCPYILTNPDLLLPEAGRLQPGAGTIAAAIRAAIDIEPVLIGKPSPILMQYALARLQATPKATWVVGDNVRTDIAAGRRAGCRTALVLTGVTTEANLERECEVAGVRPDGVFTDLGEWLAHIRA